MIPARVLPPKALVVAVTPLLDPRSVGALLDLRARGYDLAAVEVSPVPFVDAGDDETDELALPAVAAPRRAECEPLRASRRRSGTLGRRGARSPRPLEGVRAFRRHAPLRCAALAASRCGRGSWPRSRALGWACRCGGRGRSRRRCRARAGGGLLLRAPMPVPAAVALLGGEYALVLSLEGGALDLQAR